MGFSSQEYWSGLPIPSPGDLPYPGIESMSPALVGDSFITEPPGKSSEIIEEYKGAYNYISLSLFSKFLFFCVYFIMCIL